ncbi:MAG: hypothetical protein ABH858_01365 [Candidatus Omnitrophota bacterium]
MSKTIKIKSDLDDIVSLIEVLEILRDVASNHFFNAARRKERFSAFANAFVDFFRMVHFVDVDSPLVRAEGGKAVGILLITTEGSFMSDMTSKIIKAGVMEAEQSEKAEFFVVGYKGAARLKAVLGHDNFASFTNIERFGLQRIVLLVKRPACQ